MQVLGVPARDATKRDSGVQSTMTTVPASSRATDSAPARHDLASARHEPTSAATTRTIRGTTGTPASG